MNSNFGKRSSGSSNTFDFDLGLGSSQGKPLNGQKTSNPQSKPAWQPGKPSWTHQPAPKQTTIRSELGTGPTSMVGDIHGKTWSSNSSTGSGLGIGIINKDPSLFGDLVGTAIGNNNNKTNGKVPLKNAPPASVNSMGKQNNNSVNSSSMSGWGYNSNSSVNANRNSMSGSNPIGSSVPLNSDPFSSLSGFGTKQKTSGSINNSGKINNNNPQNNVFVNSSKSAQSNPKTFTSSSSVEFGNDDPLGMFSTTSNATSAPPQGATPQSEDWGFGESFGGGDDSGGTTELDGLPPPPAGVSAMSAKSKGIDNQRQGQYADAIKWLSWAVILMEKGGDEAGSAEVLSTRASCYKEVGEYKKAVADCTKVIDHDKKNVAILVQRALLYESMEKYKLGAEDLRMVLKIDPGNRIARSTVHRLTQMAG